MCKQRIDGLRLNLMWRPPRKPLKPQVFTGLDRDIARKRAEKNDGCLLTFFAAILLRPYGIRCAEAKIGMQANILSSNPGFLQQFAQRALCFGFTWFDVPLRQVPSIDMSHQQERVNGRTSHDQNAAGF